MKPRSVLLVASSAASIGLAVGFIYGWVAEAEWDIVKGRRK